MPTTDTTRRRHYFVRASAVMTAVLISASVFSPTVALAQGATVTTTTLDLTLDTGPKKNAATSAPSRPGVKKPAPRSLSSRGSSRLPSRGASGRTALRGRPAPAGQTSVIRTKVVEVLVDKANIRLGQDATSRVLQIVPRGTNLAVISDAGEYYGVLMIDNSTGWLPKSSAKMVLDYEAEVKLASPARTGGVVEDLPNGLPSNIDGRTEAILREAFTYLGVPYVWAGNTRSGLDCSGFVKNVFASVGISLPRHSGDQAKVGVPVGWEDLRAGDRLYFAMGKGTRVSHCGIYLGNGYFIHASSNRKCVDVDSLTKPSYYNALVAVRR